MFLHALRGLAVIAAASATVFTGSPAEPCRIEIIEKGSGWPVPLVELRTTHEVRFVSDNAGLIAFDLPELMGRETWFTVIGHGYNVPKDGFGYSGVRLRPEAGKTLRVEVQREIIARRMGRLTGAGIFAESQKLGLESSWTESGIVGCDSVHNALHKGRLFWLWGDTTLAKYPLGIFEGTGSFTSLQPLTTTEPPLRLPLPLVSDAGGAPRSIAKIPGSGPSWLTAVLSLPDTQGNKRLVATYSKITPPLDAYEWGLCVWNESKAVFEPLAVLWSRTNSPDHNPMQANNGLPAIPVGHPYPWNDGTNDWVLFGNPFPILRCPATFEGWRDTNQWTLLTPQRELDSASDRVEKVKPHTGSIARNASLQRWVAVFMQAFGEPSAFGELWYAEAKSPFGPWGRAVKVLSHEDYTFYNPKLHPEFTSPDSKVLFFEGTYTMTFSNNKRPTPRYDYNQILYRLDLDDPRLAEAHF
jgi:hypothetical protein